MKSNYKATFLNKINKFSPRDVQKLFKMAINAETIISKTPEGEWIVGDINEYGEMYHQEVETSESIIDYLYEQNDKETLHCIFDHIEEVNFICKIKNAVSRGDKVHWCNDAYEVIKDDYDKYLIKCNLNDTYIGLTNLIGNRLNGDVNDFFIVSKSNPSIIERAFENMENMGWSLENFQHTYDTHISTIEKVLEILDEGDLLYALQFIADFLSAIERINDEGDE